jgi:hypothetical protein
MNNSDKKNTTKTATVKAKTLCKLGLARHSVRADQLQDTTARTE